MDLLFLEFFDDFNLVLKIFFSLTIITFIRNRVTHNTLALILISAGIISMVFLFWPLFRLGYIIYVVLAAGVAGILVDFFFVNSGGSPEEIMGKKSNTPGSPGGMEHAALKNARNRPKRPF
jgi:hypothetical protein